MIADLELEGCSGWVSQTQEATQAFDAYSDQEEEEELPLQHKVGIPSARQ